MVAAVTAAVVEALVVDGGVNGLAVAMAALAAKACGRPLWWGAAAYGLIVVGLGSESMRPVGFFLGIGMLIECAWWCLPRVREV